MPETGSNPAGGIGCQFLMYAPNGAHLAGNSQTDVVLMCLHFLMGWVTPKGVMLAISLFDGWPTCAGALRLRIMHLYEASFGILPHSALKRRTKSGPLCIYNGRLPNN